MTLPTVIGVEEQEYRNPLENAPTAMQPAHVARATLGAAAHCLLSTSSAHGEGTR